jgi:L-alanine-DL-glutamate epimerase-like enolase superfamily enzyme
VNPTRRAFLGSAAALGLSACASRGGPHAPPAGLDAFTARLRDLPRKSGLKIRRLETFTRETTVALVRVTADDGSEGWGQVAPFEADITAQILHRRIAPLALGTDPYDIDTLSERAVDSNHKFPWSFVCRALSGVDTALWDLRGRREKKGVVELLGGATRPVPVYGSSMSRTVKPPDEAARLARLRDEKGFRAFKIRVGKVCGRDQDQWPGRTEELVPAVRRGVGDGAALYADGNSCYTARKAIEVGRLLEAHRYVHFEEPCPYWELEWTAEVAAALEIRVTGGEQDNDLAQWRRMVRMRAVDVVQPDVCYVGGFTRALRVAVLGAGAGLPCVPHSANQSLIQVFTVHLMAAIPNADPFMEFSIEKAGWTEGMFEPAFAVKDGAVAVPPGPGWGVTVNPAWLEKAERKVSERPV